MYMAHILMAHLIDIDDRVEQAVEAPAGRGFCRHYRHTQQPPEILVVEHRLRTLQLVIHVEGYDHRAVHVNQFGGQIEIALQIGGHHHIDYHVRSLLTKIARDIQFFGRICR